MKKFIFILLVLGVTTLVSCDSYWMFYNQAATDTYYDSYGMILLPKTRYFYSMPYGIQYQYFYHSKPLKKKDKTDKDVKE